MNAKKAPTKNSNFTAGLVLLALVMITSAVVYFTYGNNKQPTAFFARSINDASYDCEDKISARFDDRLISKYYDQFSSRYEADQHQYVIYYRVSIKEQDRDNITTVKDYMAKCIVWEKLGFVSDFMVFDKF